MLTAVAHARGASRYETGIGLVEFMIAITLGLVLITGAVSLYAGTVKSNADLVKTLRLEQELHAVMDLMLGDLRRAGSHGRPALLAGGSNPFGLDTTAAFGGEAADSCITFSYDLDQDGALDTAAGDERFGFRLRVQAIEMRRAGLACAASAAPDWEPVTNPGQTRITALQFVVNTAPAGPIDVRTVRVTLTGELADDSSISRSLLREVRVQNDTYSP
jgi:prepilin peptidase dependent protein B